MKVPANKKIIPAIIFGVLLSLNLGGQSVSPKKTDLEQSGIKASVKSITENSFDAVIDQAGSVVAGKNGDCGQNDNFTSYNENGFETKLSSSPGSDSVGSWRLNKYDTTGKLIESLVYYNKTLQHRFSYKYDAKGNRTEKIQRVIDGDFDIISSYKFDENGNELEEIYKDAYGQTKTTKGYDNKGNCVEEKYFPSDSLLYLTTYFKYDFKGNLTEEKRVYAEKKKYDFENPGRTTYRYDKEGNRIEQRNYDENNVLKSEYFRQYDFDSKGNWIKYVSFENSKPLCVTVRKIEYYSK